MCVFLRPPALIWGKKLTRNIEKKLWPKEKVKNKDIIFLIDVGSHAGKNCLFIYYNNIADGVKVADRRKKKNF